MTLYEVDTNITVESGVNKSFSILLKFVGPDTLFNADALFIMSLGHVGTIDIEVEFEKIKDISIYSLLSEAEYGDRFVFDICHGEAYPDIRDSLIIEYSDTCYTSKLYLRGSLMPEVTPNMKLIDTVFEAQSATFNYCHRFYLTNTKYLVEMYNYASKNYWEGPNYWKLRNKSGI
jgi:hypothetical protein